MADYPQIVTLGKVKQDGQPDISDILFQFPVPSQNMTITQAVKIDKIEIPGRSGNVKKATGYEDATISINIYLVDEDERLGVLMPHRQKLGPLSADKQFSILQEIFKARSKPIAGADSEPVQNTDDETVPQIYSIQSRMTDLAGIKTVIFKSLTPSDVEGTTDISVLIELEEFEVVAKQWEKSQRELVNAKNAVQTVRDIERAKAQAAHDAEIAVTALASKKAEDARLKKLANSPWAGLGTSELFNGTSTFN